MTPVEWCVVEQGGTATSDAVAVMEAAVAAEAAEGGRSKAVGDHGSRRSRGAAREADVAARAVADAAAKRNRQACSWI